MPAVSCIEGADLVTGGGASLGQVEHVLFDPSQPRAVALMVRRARALGVVARAPSFVRWADVSFGGAAVTFNAKRLPSRRAFETTLGGDADATVIWRGMPVTTVSGERVGTVGDLGLDDDGRVDVMSVSSGAAGDIAHGLLLVPGDLVRGFDGHSVVLDVREEDLRSGGGLAGAAGKGVASAKEAAGEAAKAAGDALVGASYATGRALATAAKTKPGSRARKALKGIADAYREGRGGK